MTSGGSGPPQAPAADTNPFLDSNDNDPNSFEEFDLSGICGEQDPKEEGGTSNNKAKNTSQQKKKNQQNQQNSKQKSKPQEPPPAPNNGKPSGPQPPLVLPIKQRIMILFLKSRPELNGKIGSITGYVQNTGFRGNSGNSRDPGMRYQVQIDGDQQIDLSPEEEAKLEKRKLAMRKLGKSEMEIEKELKEQAIRQAFENYGGSNDNGNYGSQQQYQQGPQSGYNRTSNPTLGKVNNSSNVKSNLNKDNINKTSQDLIPPGPTLSVKRVNLVPLLPGTDHLRSTDGIMQALTPVDETRTTYYHYCNYSRDDRCIKAGELTFLPQNTWVVIRNLKSERAVELNGREGRIVSESSVKSEDGNARYEVLISGTEKDGERIRVKPEKVWL